MSKLKLRNVNAVKEGSIKKEINLTKGNLDTKEVCYDEKKRKERNESKEMTVLKRSDVLK